MANKKGRTIHSEARNIIASVIKMCDEEKTRNILNIPLSRATERAAAYTGVSEATIKTIRKELKIKNFSGSQSPIKSPGKRRPRPKERNVDIDDFDLCVIRRTVHDFYTVNKVVPTCRKLLPVIREKINFPWGIEALRRILHKTGFKWRKCNAKRQILIERPDIIFWRARFLRTMADFRRECRPIFYLDESWVDSNLTFQKCWQSNEVTGICADGNAANRLIMVHVGSRSGFLHNASLVYKAGTTVGDYHGQMNSGNFEKWVREKLLTSLPPNSVVVLDNAPYHNLQIDKPPTRNSVKPEMVSWLQRQGVVCDISMRKDQLYERVVINKPRDKIFKIDELLKLRGHTTVRLPPYNCDLSPIELAWAKVKRYVRENNVSGDMSLSRLKELTRLGIESVTANDWEGYCNHVEDLEKRYWDRDGLVSDVVDSIIIQNVNDDENSSCDDNSSDSEHDHHSLSDSDSELALPL